MFGIVKDSEVIAEFAAPLTVRSNRPVYATDLLNLKRSIGRLAPAQRWEIETRLVPVSGTAGQLFSLLARHGHNIPIELQVPQPYGAIEFLMYNSKTLTATPITINSLSLSGTLSPEHLGCFFRLDNNGKLYIITDISGNEIQVFPNLVNVPGPVTLWLNNAIRSKFFLDTDSIAGMAYTDGVLMDNGVIKFIEALGVV